MAEPVLMTDAGQRHEKQFGVLGYRDASKFGNSLGRLANDLHGRNASFLVKHDGFKLGLFFRLDEISTALDQQLHGFVAGFLVVEDHRLVGGADSAVVEGLGSDNVVDRNAEVGGLGNEYGGVTGADADSGVTGFVGGLDHGVTAGGENQVHARMVEEHTGGFNGRSFDPLDAILGGAGGNSGVQHDLGCFGAALLCAGMESKDDHVTGLHGDQRLEHDGRSRVGGRSGGRQYAERLGNVLHAFFLFYDTNGFFVLEVLINNVSAEVILDGFVVSATDTGFLNGHFGKLDFVGYAGRIHGRGNLIDLFLGVGLKFGGSLFSIGYQLIDHCLCHT